MICCNVRQKSLILTTYTVIAEIIADAASEILSCSLFKIYTPPEFTSLHNHVNLPDFQVNKCFKINAKSPEYRGLRDCDFQKILNQNIQVNYLQSNSIYTEHHNKIPSKVPSSELKQQSRQIKKPWKHNVNLVIDEIV